MIYYKNNHDFELSIPFVIGVLSTYNILVFKLFFLRFSIERVASEYGNLYNRDRFGIGDCGFSINFNSFILHFFQVVYDWTRKEWSWQ